MSDTILSIIMLAAIALLAGGIFLLRRGEKKQGRLMLILAFVMALNIAIWVLPVAVQDGDSDGGGLGEATAIEQ